MIDEVRRTSSKSLWEEAASFQPRGLGVHSKRSVRWDVAKSHILVTMSAAQYGFLMTCSNSEWTTRSSSLVENTNFFLAGQLYRSHSKKTTISFLLFDFISLKQG